MGRYDPSSPFTKKLRGLGRVQGMNNLKVIGFVLTHVLPTSNIINGQRYLGRHIKINNIWSELSLIGTSSHKHVSPVRTSFKSEHGVRVHVFFKKKMGQPLPIFIYFWSFQTTNTSFTTNQCEKMSSPSSIPCQDSNPRPLEHESSPITTRPGLPPERGLVWLWLRISDLGYFLLQHVGTGHTVWPSNSSIRSV